jgi:hypothetical protein
MLLIDQTGHGATVYKRHTVSHALRVPSDTGAAYFKGKSNPE